MGPQNLVAPEASSAMRLAESQLLAAAHKSNSNSREVSSSSVALRIAEDEQVVRGASAVRGDIQSMLRVRAYRPHGLKPIPSRVLEEDDYVKLLQLIIERDFFPDLIKLRLEKEVLQKQQTGDVAAARDAALRLNSVKAEQDQRPHGVAPYSASLGHPRVKLLDGRELELNLSQLSLKEFQSLFTSEDNFSFERIVQEEKIRLSKEQAWIEQSAIRHNARNEETKAALETGDRPARLLYSNMDSRNPFMFPITDGNVGVMEIKRLPGRTNDAEQTVALSLGSYAKDDAPASIVSRGSIVHSNTRIEATDDSVGSALLGLLSLEQQKKKDRADRAAKGEALFDEMVTRGTYSATLVEHQRQIEQLNNRRRGVYTVAEIKGRGLQTPTLTPSNCGYEFVHTPSLVPGVDTTPLMTWGRVAATPLLLSGGRPETPGMQQSDAGSEGGPRFEIPELSNKEVAARRLQEKAGRNMRAQRQSGCQSSSSHLRKAIKALTPAGSRIRTSMSGLFTTTPRLRLMRSSLAPSTLTTPLLIRLTGTATPNRQRLSTPQGPAATTPLQPEGESTSNREKKIEAQTSEKRKLEEAQSSDACLAPQIDRPSSDLTSRRREAKRQRRNSDMVKGEKEISREGGKQSITDDLLEF